MALNFPNLSRSFEAKQNRVRFWGYDSAIEITFFIETEALPADGGGSARSEEDLLVAFDSALERIHAAARKVYERQRGGSCVCELTARDL